MQPKRIIIDLVHPGETAVHMTGEARVAITDIKVLSG